VTRAPSVELARSIDRGRSVAAHLRRDPGVRVIRMPEHYGVLSPILHVVPLQLLAYHTACARGTDVDKPRNLAKSVTVE
jgi:glucosamine--fructose-6-phosphate aminotransferase (isomerizing)